ncbi:MAG: YraN family protein [Oscillospiraceae bacterium]|nr:YraN family protein [Oscillospiraceae bacterium]
MSIKKTRGDFGEEHVCTYLGNHGYEILARNYRKRTGEIDIIAIKEKTITFVEVKTRKHGSLTAGITAVNPEKQRKIIKTAEHFLKENPQHYGRKMRFDAAEVYITTDETPQIIEMNYYNDAYDTRLL